MIRKTALVFCMIIAGGSVSACGKERERSVSYYLRNPEILQKEFEKCEKAYYAENTTELPLGCLKVFEAEETRHIREYDRKNKK